jgi:hypothetical protein
VIGACNNLTTSGTTVTCNWMPSVKGAITITAFVTPNSDTLGSTSPPLALLVGARSSRR